MGNGKLGLITAEGQIGGVQCNGAAIGPGANIEGKYALADDRTFFVADRQGDLSTPIAEITGDVAIKKRESC